MECRPEKLPSACPDENVDIHLIRPFHAWKLLIQTIEVKKSTHVWICGTCQQDIEEADSIGCDLCLESVVPQQMYKLKEASKNETLVL